MFNFTVKTECLSSFENDAGINLFFVLLSIIASCATSCREIYYYLLPFEKKWLAKQSALSNKNFFSIWEEEPSLWDVTPCSYKDRDAKKQKWSSFNKLS